MKKPKLEREEKREMFFSLSIRSIYAQFRSRFIHTSFQNLTYQTMKREREKKEFAETGRKLIRLNLRQAENNYNTPEGVGDVGDSKTLRDFYLNVESGVKYKITGGSSRRRVSSSDKIKTIV